MRLSLITWCRDWPPLRQVTPVNLALTAGREDVEHVILDVGSTDDTVQWLEGLLCERLRVFYQPVQPLHFGRCYNAAARQARGEVLAFLDADNVIGPRYVARMLDELEQQPRAIVQAWTGRWGDGTCGRLALRRELFEELGGFDESLGPCGYQDLDLRERVRAAPGGQVVTVNDWQVVGLSIQNDRKKKLQHLPKVQYDRVNGMNQKTSLRNIAAGRIRANHGGTV